MPAGAAMVADVPPLAPETWAAVVVPLTAKLEPRSRSSEPPEAICELALVRIGPMTDVPEFTGSSTMAIGRAPTDPAQFMTNA